MKSQQRHRASKGKNSIFFLFISVFSIGLITVMSSFYEKSWSFNWTDINSQVRDSVQIAQNDPLTFGPYIRGKKFDLYGRRIWIMKNSSIKELEKLLEYPNGNIKAIAYQGLLLDPEYKDKFNLVLKSIDEQQYGVTILSGCIGNTIPITEYLATFVLHMRLGDKAPPPSSSIDVPDIFNQEEWALIVEEYLRKENNGLPPTRK